MDEDGEYQTNVYRAQNTQKDFDEITNATAMTFSGAVMEGAILMDESTEDAFQNKIRISDAEDNDIP